MGYIYIAHLETWISLFSFLLCASVKAMTYSPHFRVTSILTEPYLMLNPRHPNATGNERYHGYIVDLMDELSHLIGIDYRIYVVEDGSYGFRRKDGSWDGLIGELISRKADIAAAPMYITEERKQAVPFSDPFLHVYASVLMDKNKINLTTPEITSARDLVHQRVFKYGTLNTGVIIHALKTTNDTDYKRMWQTMLNNKSLFARQNKLGIERVRRERYAYVIPSVIADYVARQAPCDLVVIDRFLMHRKFSLAFPPKSELVDEMNMCIQELKDRNRLKQLYDKWWKDKNHCSSGDSIISAWKSNSNDGNTTLFGMLNVILNVSSCLVAYMVVRY